MVIYRKLNRWIEARASSVSSGKGKDPSEEKGETAEVEGMSCVPAAGPSENICRTVTKHFVKRYQRLFRNDELIPCLPVGRLTRRSNFSAPKGEIQKRKVVTKMKKILALIMAMVMVLSLVACGTTAPVEEVETPVENEAPVEEAAFTGVEDGVLTVAMECAYAPYNWSQPDDANGAVPIVNAPGSYANGYDVMMAKTLCEANGWELEVMQLDWDSLVPAVQNGTVDAVIAGQSMTADRMEMVDFAGPYLYATIICLTKADSALANATGISELSGTCTSQLGTIWYDTCLPQIEGADIQAAAESAPAMLMALETGMVDFVCTDMPTGQGALEAYDDFVLLDFAGSEDDFEVSDEDVNIGISVMKGNTVLKDAMDAVLSTMTADDFNAMMADAIAVQPIG